MTLTISFYPFCHLSFLISSPLTPSSHSPFFPLLLSPFPSPFTSPSLVSCLSSLSSSSLSSHPNISNLFHSTLHPLPLYYIHQSHPPPLSLS